MAVRSHFLFLLMPGELTGFEPSALVLPSLDDHSDAMNDTGAPATDSGSGGVLRVAVGTPDEPFASAWRFWTYGDSAYFAQRTLGGSFKASFHPARGPDKPAAWTHGFTRESKQVFDDIGSRRSHTWQQPAEFMPGWYTGPAISVPRLQGRPYDRPSRELLQDSRGVDWVGAPEAGECRFLRVFLSDDRADLPPFELGEGDSVVGTLEMTTGWHASVITATRCLETHEIPILEKTRDDMRIGLTGSPQGTESGSIIWVTTSPDGPPLFVQIVLGSDNFYDQSET